jgi:secreted trypsin-like serine protease
MRKQELFVAVTPFRKATVLGAIALAAGAANAGVQGLAYQSRPHYITTEPGTPAGANTGYNTRHRPTYGGEHSGVARLVLDTGAGSFLCSGALLSTGRHVLTAAHCVTDAAGKLNVTGGTASFPITPTGPFGLGNIAADPALGVARVTVHPGYNGDYLFKGNDLAIITLSGDAPLAAQRYELYTGSDELEKVSDKVGWGSVGQGDTGTTTSPGAGWRKGQNVWEMTASQFWGDPTVSSNILMYDFDNGLAANDAFDAYFGKAGLGLGAMEVGSGPGDSGGPSFLDGKIAGVTSFGLTFTDMKDANGNFTLCSPANPDVLCGVNSTFGEFAGDTRVSGYNQWIMSSIPEPETYALMLAGLGLVGFIARRRAAAAPCRTSRDAR